MPETDPSARLGRYILKQFQGETVRAFVPPPLPPMPPVDLTRFQILLEQANQAVGRLDGLASLLPDLSLLLYTYVRKEAVLSSQIEGTQSSLSDLLLYENDEAPGVPIEDVQEVSNYVAAMNRGLERMRSTISRSLEKNSAHFNQARDKLEKWADDMVLGAEKALLDTKEQIKALRRQARQAIHLEEQRQIQEKIQKLERQQRRQRQEIFAVEDEIMAKRDALVDSLEKRLSQRTEVETG